MSDKLYIEPGSLRDQAPKFHEAATRLKKIHDDLWNKLHGVGACWGEDKTGKAFEDKYSPGRAKSMIGMTDTVTSLDGMGDACKAIADNYEKVEDEAKSAVDNS